MAFNAKFPGTCRNCESAFPKGALVSWNGKVITACPACHGNPVSAGVMAQNKANREAAQATREAKRNVERPAFDAAKRNALLASLDPEQAAVAAWTPAHGNARVVAAAGSGKTTTVTALVGNLLIGNVVNPADLMVTTFTRKAADELVERLSKVVPHDLLNRVTVNTFHGIALTALRASAQGHRWPANRNVDGTGNRAQDVYGKDVIWERALDGEQIRGLGVYGIGAPNDAWKDYIMAVECIRADGHRHGSDAAKAACESTGLHSLHDAWGLYEQQKQAMNAYDFADALDAYYDLAQSNGGGRIVIVDEAQDNSRLQIGIALALAGQQGRIVMVGDVRQSIYEWRGGAPELFLRADEVMQASTLYMTRNYRSGAEIVAIGNRVAEGRTWSLGPASIVGVPERQGEGRITVRGYADEGDVAHGVTEDIAGALEGRVMAPSDFAVLCRTRAQQGNYEAELLAAGIPVAIVGGSSFFTSKAWRDYIALLAVVTGHAGAEDLQRAVKREPGCGFWAGRACADALRATRDPVLAINAAAPGVRTAKVRTALLAFARWATDARNALGVDGLPSFAAVCERVAERLMAATTEGDGRTDEDNRASYEVASRLAASRGSTLAAQSFAARCAGAVANADKAEEAEGRVCISTMHKAKGREWPVVYVDATAGVFPHIRCEGNERRMEEEARLFYVAVTRAKQALHLTYSASYNAKAAGKSAFIAAFAPQGEPTPPPATEPVPVAPVEDSPRRDDAALAETLAVAGEIMDELGVPQDDAPPFAPTASELRAALAKHVPVAERLTAEGAKPEPGERFVIVTLEDFDALLGSHGFSLDADAEESTGQRVLSVTLQGGESVMIYTSIPEGDDVARGLGEDSIKVVALNALGRPAMKRQPYAARTVNWRRTLLSRIDTALAALE